MKSCRISPISRFSEGLIRLSLALLGSAGLTGAAGCSSPDCGDSGTCEDPCGVDDAAGSRGEECGVFLSASLGNDANPGTRAEPVKTLQHAIDVAASGTTVKGVYACAETFAEVVKLPAGVSLWGGLKCAEDWRVVSDPTFVKPEEDAVPLTVEGKEGEDPWPVSEIAHVRVEAVGATRPGGTSFAMLVTPFAAVTLVHSELLTGDGAAPGGGAVALFLEDHTDLKMRDCSLVAGNGAEGADGKSGNSDPPPRAQDAQPGAEACTAKVAPGAPASVAMLDDMVSRGGKGGDGGVNGGTDGEDGTPDFDDDPRTSYYGGGGYGSSTSRDACTDGRGGKSAKDRPTSMGGRDFGTMTRAGWVGSAGQDGVDGEPGQGGGGGGGTYGGAMFCGTLPKGGASGGAGGAGGLGGLGGKGGGGGGSSFGVFMLGRSTLIKNTTIKTGSGGKGGSGGVGGTAGEGQPGARGGLGRGGSPAGCRGGDGGRGGRGGWGGGGRGGHSLAFVYAISPGVLPPDIDIDANAKGGGHGGGTGAWGFGQPTDFGADGLSGRNFILD
jgi:hypothetical protein